MILGGLSPELYLRNGLEPRLLERPRSSKRLDRSRGLWGGVGVLDWWPLGLGARDRSRHV